ncbi:hypothetical protein [Bacillus alkalicellulosilyticus]|uniref:hypothetical protein n=1 Tax=Alkalihalobacterium alkalicellulosilyticum TaxID=1912214 RepID=UPI0009984B35|nr:hypothetical protein [Bacillus alkalicellulosilyticus]
MDKTKRLRIRNGTMIFFILVLVFDLVVFIMSKNNYYFSFVKSTNNKLLILLTLVSFYAFAITHKLHRVLIIIVTFTAFLYLGWFGLTNNSYHTIDSPSGNVKVMIGHRDVTFGETNHFYEFYLYTSIPGLMKKVEKHKILTRRVYAGNLEVLGVDDAEWIDDNKIIFHSQYAEDTQVDLKQ